MARQGWIHGWRLYREHVVEVKRVVERHKGQPDNPLGWLARIVIHDTDVEVATTRHYPTQAEAEQAVCDALNKLTGEDEP